MKVPMRVVRPWLILSSLSVSLLALACKSDDHYTDAAAGDGGDRVDGRGDLVTIAFPAAVALGPIDCGATRSQTFDVENAGAADYGYTIMSSSPAFTITPSSGTIIAGTMTTFTVEAAVANDAVAGAALTGQLTVLTTAGTDVDAQYLIDVDATPRGGTLTLTPGGASFGDVELGLSSTADVVVRNTGNLAVGVAIGAPSDDAYAVAFTDGELAAAAMATAVVTYTPGALGTTSATAPVTVTGVTCGEVPTTLAMGGTGTPDGGVNVTGAVAFGDVSCGASPDTRTITLTNDGHIPATWTSAYLADPQGDGSRYQLSATSGTLAAGASQEVTLTRLAIAVPAEPRAYDVTLRITTVGQLTQTHDLDVTQTLRGPVLALDAHAHDFGFAPVGEILSTTLSTSNSGNAGGTATFTASGAGFSVPATGASFGSGGPSVTVSYAPTALGSRTGSVAIEVPGACNPPLSVQLAGGHGPWTSMGEAVAQRTCGDTSGFGSSIWVFNPGTVALSISGCTEISNTDVAPVFAPFSMGAGSGSSTLSFHWSNPSPLRSGTTVATVRCNTNERHHTTRTFSLTRTTLGQDLVIEPADGDFAFSCATTPPFTEKHLRVTNHGNQAGHFYSSSSLPAPLYNLSRSFNLAPGQSSSLLGVGMGSGGCATGGIGSIGVGTGSANVCSMSPSTTLPITLVP